MYPHLLSSEEECATAEQAWANFSDVCIAARVLAAEEQERRRRIQELTELTDFFGYDLNQALRNKHPVSPMAVKPLLKVDEGSANFFDPTRGAPKLMCSAVGSLGPSVGLRRREEVHMPRWNALASAFMEEQLSPAKRPAKSLNPPVLVKARRSEKIHRAILNWQTPLPVPPLQVQPRARRSSLFCKPFNKHFGIRLPRKHTHTLSVTEFCLRCKAEFEYLHQPHEVCFRGGKLRKAPPASLQAPFHLGVSKKVRVQISTQDLSSDQLQTTQTKGRRRLLGRVMGFFRA